MLWQQLATFPSRRYRTPVVWSVDEYCVEIDEMPPSKAFELALYVNVNCPEAGKELGYGDAYSEEELRDGLFEYAEVLQRYGQLILAHDPAMFSRMMTVKYWELPPMERRTRPKPPAEPPPLYQSARSFESSYVDGGILRFRSPKPNSSESSVEVLFDGVRALELRVQFEGIRIEEADRAFLQQFPSKPENVLELGSKIYALRGNDWLGFVVGSTLAIKESGRDHAKPGDRIDSPGPF